MLNIGQELVWQGRIHLGDEPGIYGDALYVGLCAELPLTIMSNALETEMTPKGVGLSDSVRFVLEAEDVRTYEGYPGHQISIVEHFEASEGLWQERVIGQGKLWDMDNIEITLDLSGKQMPLFLSVRIKVDTSVPAGLYDDFVIKKLSVYTHGSKYYSSFGFRPLNRWKGVILMQKEE